MRGRLFTLVSCLLLSISSVDAVHAASLTEQRRLYDQAKAALAKGNSAPYMASRSALRDYPLEPYLAYDEDPPAEDRQQRGGRALPHRTRRPAADRLAETALAAPAGRSRRLEDLRQLLRSEAELHRTRLPVWPVPAGHGQKAEGYATSERLWLVGKSQPAACDTLFGLWQGEGQLTEEKVWKRLKLAAEARNYSLASHLAQRLPTLATRAR